MSKDKRDCYWACVIWNRYDALLNNYQKYSLDHSHAVKPAKQTFIYNMYQILMHVLHT